uniref:hypothetical protein n=1 Tax=Agrobacterium tumefaciens TaxID=358 RepID=UPI003B9E04D7
MKTPRSLAAFEQINQLRLLCAAIRVAAARLADVDARTIKVAVGVRHTVMFTHVAMIGGRRQAIRWH